jgi:2,5-diketo-D-gluconate reductase A
MPVLGLGTWMLTSQTAARVSNALASGYRMVDTSADYLTQSGIGKALRAAGFPREEIFVITKVEEDDDGYEATRKNLAEMKLEYADLVKLDYV